MNVTLANVSVSGCRVAGVKAWNAVNLTVEHGYFAHNSEGVAFLGFDSRRSTLRIDASHFERNGLGVRSLVSSTNVTNSQFRTNGGPDARAPPAQWGPGGLLIGATGTVRNSSFEGNAGYGLSATFAADARDNWWGSPQGPLVQTAAGPVGPGGDVAAGYVDFVPFLTSPP